MTLIHHLVLSLAGNEDAEAFCDRLQGLIPTGIKTAAQPLACKELLVPTLCAVYLGNDASTRLVRFFVRSSEGGLEFVEKNGWLLMMLPILVVLGLVHLVWVKACFG
jgi:hypothetical protein